MEKFEIDYKFKAENGKYDPAKWNAKDANEVKRTFDAFAVAVAEAFKERDKQFDEALKVRDDKITDLTERLETAERQINLGLVEAGLVQPDYLQPEKS